MDFGLRGRNALVFGGTRGIGRAIANTLAVEGADVAICAEFMADMKPRIEATKKNLFWRLNE